MDWGVVKVIGLIRLDQVKLVERGSEHKQHNITKISLIIKVYLGFLKRKPKQRNTIFKIVHFRAITHSNIWVLLLGISIWNRLWLSQCAFRGMDCNHKNMLCDVTSCHVMSHHKKFLSHFGVSRVRQLISSL